MPIIEGVKYSCEPCMRGHRSTKCQHTDRILVRVRRPGRPLSSCPHPSSLQDNVRSGTSTFTAAFSHIPKNAEKSNSCGCEAVAVAIPKAASCQCCKTTPGNDGSSACSGNGTNRMQTSGFSVSQLSRSNGVSNPPTYAGISKMGQSKRRPGVDSSQPRNKRNSVALPTEFPPGFFESIMNGTGQSGLDPFRGVSEKPEEVTFTNTAGWSNANTANVDQQYFNSFPVSGLDFPNGAENHINTPLPGFSVHANSPLLPGASTTKTTKGCCSKKNLQAADVAFATHSPTHLGQTICGGTGNQASESIFMAGPPGAAPRCHSSTSNGEDPKGQDAHAPISSSFRDNSLALKPEPQVTTQSFLPSDLSNQSATATPLTFLDQSATQIFTFPLSYSSFNNPITLQEHAQFLQTWPNFNNNQTPVQSNISHVCGCGPSCNCLGCAAHPYNKSTLEFINSVRDLAQADSPSTESVDEKKESYGNITTTGESENRSPMLGEVSPSAFFHVEYPSGSEDCRCEDGCQCSSCWGCLARNQIGLDNGFLLDANSEHWADLTAGVSTHADPDRASVVG